MPAPIRATTIGTIRYGPIMLSKSFFIPGASFVIRQAILLQRSKIFFVACSNCSS
jgi:hypothetical protein